MFVCKKHRKCSKCPRNTPEKHCSNWIEVIPASNNNIKDNKKDNED